MLLNYHTMSLADVRAQLDEIARDVQATFGHLDPHQLNWRPDESSWSIAQCLEHLVTANALMLQRAEDALDSTHPRTLWQRLPGLPRLFGRLLIRSQAPENTRKFVAPQVARPSSSSIAPDVVERFVDQHRMLAQRIGALDERRAAEAIMQSPFIKVVAYSVLDGFRLLVTHDHRHIAQARRALGEVEGRGKVEKLKSGKIEKLKS